jgi:hypothetical protein
MGKRNHILNKGISAVCHEIIFACRKVLTKKAQVVKLAPKKNK